MTQSKEHTVEKGVCGGGSTLDIWNTTQQQFRSTKKIWKWNRAVKPKTTQNTSLAPLCKQYTSDFVKRFLKRFFKECSQPGTNSCVWNYSKKSVLNHPLKCIIKAILKGHQCFILIRVSKKDLMALDSNPHSAMKFTGWQRVHYSSSTLKKTGQLWR